MDMSTSATSATSRKEGTATTAISITSRNSTLTWMEHLRSNETRRSSNLCAPENSLKRSYDEPRYQIQPMHIMKDHEEERVQRPPMKRQFVPNSTFATTSFSSTTQSCPGQINQSCFSIHPTADFVGSSNQQQQQLSFQALVLSIDMEDLCDLEPRPIETMLQRRS
jgi:hypothetical protein